MAARVWGQPAGGFCSREDDGWPSDADPTARSRGSKQAERADWAGSASVARVRGGALPRRPRRVLSGPSAAGQRRASAPQGRTDLFAMLRRPDV